MTIPKHGLAIMVGKLTGKHPDEESPEVASDHDEANGEELEMAMEDLLDAIEGGLGKFTFGTVLL